MTDQQEKVGLLLNNRDEKTKKQNKQKQSKQTNKTIGMKKYVWHPGVTLEYIFIIHCPF